MADIALDYDELLDGGAAPWKRRLIIGGAALIIAATGAYFAWNQWMRGGSSVAAPVFTEGTVATGNINKTISTSGVVSAARTSNLNFSSSGKVTKVDVALGQAVKQGDVLAEIDPADAQNALRTAQASLASAQSKLQTLIQGSTASQLASADQSVLQAQSSYDKAVQALADLQAPADALSVQAAQQAVVAAQAKLASAQEARDNVDTKAADDVTKAKADLAKAKDTLASAKQSRDDADASLSTAEGALNNSETAYCVADGVLFCGGHAVPVSDTDISTLVDVTNGSDATLAQAAQKVLSANSSYRSAVTARDKADTAVGDAQDGVDSANSALDDAEAEPSAAQIATADASVSGAQVDLASANKKLADLLAGPTQTDVRSAQSAVDQAAASLKSAQAKRDETYAGSTSADIQSQRNSVQQAQVNVDNAQKNLDDTHLKAPFDGTVAALNVQVGDTAGTGTGTAASSAVVLNTPDLVVLNLTVSETDYPSVKAGDGGYAVFSALPNGISPFVIDSVGVNPTTTQGVVTYQAKAHIVTGPQAASILRAIAPSGAGANRAAASGTPQAGRTPGAGGTPQTGGTPQADRTPGAGRAGNGGAFSGNQFAANAAAVQPAPGMNATITIIVDQRTGVLYVPTKAIQTSGRTSFVTVKNADGTTQDVTVTTGLADGTNTEILSGLTDGQAIRIPGKATTTTTSALPATGGFGGGGNGGFRPPGD